MPDTLPVSAKGFELQILHFYPTFSLSLKEHKMARWVFLLVHYPSTNQIQASLASAGLLHCVPSSHGLGLLAYHLQGQESFSN